MRFTILIYPIISKGIVLRDHVSVPGNVKSYVLTHKEKLRTVYQYQYSECVVIVNMKIKQYYIHTLPDCSINIKELRTEISNNIQNYKDQLIQGTRARIAMYKK